MRSIGLLLLLLLSCIGMISLLFISYYSDPSIDSYVAAFRSDTLLLSFRGILRRGSGTFLRRGTAIQSGTLVNAERPFKDANIARSSASVCPFDCDIVVDYSFFSHSYLFVSSVSVCCCCNCCCCRGFVLLYFFLLLLFFSFFFQ